jgi:rare lipoprotein A (peptidoglycan hydrolase)
MISNWRLHIIGGALALMSLSLIVSCATQPELPQSSSPPHAVEPPATGLSVPATSRSSTGAVRASYQGSEYAGRRTASGEPYDPEALTAASRTLPIGSTVMVTNPATGHSVRVRINDRGGPRVHGRGLDLSKHAAEELGMTKKGVARVKVRRVDSSPAGSDSPNSLGGSSSTSAPKS